MKKYCRYCGKKMSDPRDNFCYACRKPGRPVDFFYRYAKKVDMDEDEIDMIRMCGEFLSLGALIFGSGLASVLIFCLVINAVGAKEDHVSDIFLAVMFLILAVLLIYAVFGIGLLWLDKRFVNREWKITVIMLFVGLFRSRRDGIAIISAALTHNKKVKQENLLRIALMHLANGEKPAEKAVETNQPLSNWVCRFCGYENPSSRMECKSCGKIK